MVRSNMKKKSQPKQKTTQKTVVESKKSAVPAEKSRFGRDIGFFGLGMFCMALIGYGVFLAAYPVGKVAQKCSLRVYPLSCCKMQQSVEKERMSSYMPVEYAPYLKAGNHVIEGRIMPKAVVGRRHRGQAGRFEKEFVPVLCRAEVFANPVTSYSREWFNRNWAGVENIEDADPRVWRTHFKAKVRPDGSFVFENLPAGEYFVAARACVRFHPAQRGCKEVRFGKRVQTGVSGSILLNPVYRAK